MYDVEVIREDFPILQRRVGERPLVYLDSANTSQKPRQVVDAIAEHYLTHNANVAHARNADLGRISVPIQNVYLVTKATARHVLSAHHAGRETARNALEMIVGHAKNATAGHVQNAATTTVVIR